MRLKIAPIAVPTSIVLLGIAIHIRDGLYNPWALAFLTASAAACGFAILSGGISELRDRALFELALKITLALQALAIVTIRRGVSWKIFVITLIAVLASLFISKLGRWGAAVVLMMFALAGVTTLHSSSRPYIDTFVQNRDSCDSLLHGINPYTISFPDVYEGNSFTYPPGLVHDGRVWMGYPYPPLPLLLQMPAFALTGDPRYAQLLAMLLAATFLIAIDLRLGTLAAALLLFSPRALYVLDMSWVEPFMIMLLASSVWAAIRAPKLLPITLGLFLASKQHIFLCLPLTILLTGNRRDAGKLIIKSILVAAIVSLPVVLWNWWAFFENAIRLQFRLPFRDDSLSYLAWVAQLGGGKMPALIGFATMAGAIAFVLKRFRPHPGNFALGIGVCFFALFAFNKQAFCNYYFFVIGAMCCALASSSPAEAGHADGNQGAVVG